MINTNNVNKGFTLIELLVVISIIGVLTALLLSNFVGIRGRAKDAQLKGDLEQLKVALRLYYNDFQEYPGPTTMGMIINGCGAGTDPCSGAVFATTSTTYMKELPTFNEYAQTSGGDGFYLGVVLSNGSDTDIANSATECSAPATLDTFYVCAD